MGFIGAHVEYMTWVGTKMIIIDYGKSIALRVISKCFLKHFSQHA